MAVKSIFTKAAKKAISKADKAKMAREAKKQRKLQEDQTRAGMTSAEKKAAGIGEESPARVMMGEAAKKRSGLINDYRRTLKQVEENPNLSDEQLERAMNKLADMRQKLKDAGVDVSQFKKGGTVKKAKGHTDYRMNKGGLLLSSKDNRKKK